MTRHVSADLRRMVYDRAAGECEYRRIHERDTYLGCQIDHVVSIKHGGVTEPGNLALACTFCNRAKGTDIGSHGGAGGEFVRFFNPRMDAWEDHFSIAGDRIEPKTPQAEATVKILKLNSPERLIERIALIEIGRFPPPPIEHD